jgi:hypothetical protein
MITLSVGPLFQIEQLPRGVEELGHKKCLETKAKSLKQETVNHGLINCLI